MNKYFVVDNTISFHSNFMIASGFIRGPGENVKPVALSFHDKFKQGALLSVVSILKLVHSLYMDIN